MLHERSSDLASAAKVEMPIEEFPAASTNGVDRYGRIAVVHDWCPNFRGGERVLAQICKQFPNAEVFTLFDFLPAEVKEQYFRDVEFHTSAANRLPMIEKFYRSLFSSVRS